MGYDNSSEMFLSFYFSFYLEIEHILQEKKNVAYSFDEWMSCDPVGGVCLSWKPWINLKTKTS